MAEAETAAAEEGCTAEQRGGEVPMAGIAMDQGAEPSPQAVPRVIVVAGVPRSGSTWLFNVARLVLETGYPRVYACWQADYAPDSHATCDVHLVKMHLPEHLTFRPDRILTTRRDLAERLASLIRMGWLTEDPAVVRNAAAAQQELYAFWKARSSLEVDYSALLKQPHDMVQAVARVLDIRLDPSQAEQIADVVAQAEPPSQGPYVRLTLLHPGHRSDPETTAALAARVRAILGSGFMDPDS